MPGVLKVTGTGPAFPETTVAVLVANAEPVHEDPEYTLNVTVPPGLNPPVIVAVSVTELPAAIVVFESVVVTDGVALVTVRFSEPQLLLEPRLLLSPE